MTPTIEPVGGHADARTYLTFGTEADGRQWLDREVVSDAPFPVNRAEIGRFCAMVEDPDENHWDQRAAERRHGGIVSPPGMFMVWGFPLPWHPDGPPDHAPLVALDVPLPGSTLINVATTTTFAAPMREGDLLRFRSRLTALSQEKTTPLGTGHFLTTQTDAHRADGTPVGSNQNVLFRYDAAPASEEAPASDAAVAPDEAPPTPARDDAAEDVDLLPEISFPLTSTRVAAMIPAATRDLFPGHHDRAYAREQGAADVYVNTMFLHGLVDRVGKAWAGPDAWLVERTLTMRTPACVGQLLQTRGRVVARSTPDGRRLAELTVDVLADGAAAASAGLTFDLDGHQESPR